MEKEKSELVTDQERDGLCSAIPAQDTLHGLQHLDKTKLLNQGELERLLSNSKLS